MVNGKLVGIKHAHGVSRTGKNYDFYKACVVSDMTSGEIEQGSVGQSVHEVMVPDSLTHVFNAGNVGKDISADFYFANGNERVGYATLIEPKK